MNYWQVVAQFERINEKGRVQKIKESYLVDAQTGTEAEAKTYKFLESQGESDFKIVRLSESNIIKVF